MNIFKKSNINFFLFLVFFLTFFSSVFSAGTKSFDQDREYLGSLKTMAMRPSNSPPTTIITAYVASAWETQLRGLSHIKAGSLKSHEAMLFYYDKEEIRTFWMPDTYFNLDIYFLDKNYKILAIERRVPHYKGKHNPDKIPRTKEYLCTHVLEMDASSPLSQKLKIGDNFILF